MDTPSKTITIKREEMNPEDFTKVQVDVGVLKSQTKTLTDLCNKMDSVIDRILANEDKWLERVYEDMDKRKTETTSEIKEMNNRINSVAKELSDRIDSSENRIMAEIRTIRNEFITQRKSERDAIAKILEWKYMIAGGIITIGWIITHFDIAKFFRS